MRKRYQKGNVFKRGKAVKKWVMQWWEDGHRRKRTLEVVSKMTKTEAQAELAAILAPLNNREDPPSKSCMSGNFIERVFLPLYRQKWKKSTRMTSEHRIKYHVVTEFGNRALGDFDREQLQSFLNRKTESGLSRSTVDHLRWDLRAIFGMAVAEGILLRNPAQQLFTPRDCPRPKGRILSTEEVRTLLYALDTRERLIAKLALLAGMRPGEIFALKWSHLESDYADIQQRIYRGDIDSPKSSYSVRWAALSDGVLSAIEEWKSKAIDSSADAWVFPSEKLTTPIRKDNCWRRYFAPRLEAVGLTWANFQVMRRTHSCLMKELDVDPQVRAEQMGHTVDVNQNVYTRSSQERRRDAVNKVESALSLQ